MSSASDGPGALGAEKGLALLSVSDRAGLTELASGLAELGYRILSTGGTAAHLARAGLSVTNVSDLTGFPEVFSGRVKTLHPVLFGGLLYDRSLETHRAEAVRNAVPPIDLLAVNLYPFEETLRLAQESPEDGPKAGEIIEKIDVGGPSLLRAAAKNHAHVTALCDPADYPDVLEELRMGGVSPATRRRLAAKVFRHTAAYDAAIARWFLEDPAEDRFPERLSLSFERRAVLRYGENPHQCGAHYIDRDASASSLSRFTIVQGKELSYNNLLDADAALVASRHVGKGALTIVKHRIASGIASGEGLSEAFEAAWASDPVAGFGGVVAWTGSIDRKGAEALVSRFLEVVVAYGLEDEAKEPLSRKPNLRVLIVRPEEGSLRQQAALSLRVIDGGLLVQDPDVDPPGPGDVGLAIPMARVVTRRAPTPEELSGLEFAWRAVRGVISNAIVVARDRATVGIGGGRTSRVDACRDAVEKAGPGARGAVAASDAFFPFADGLETLAQAGVSAVIQPGGSKNDHEVIAAADRLGVAMVFTGRRHFRH